MPPGRQSTAQQNGEMRSAPEDKAPQHDNLRDAAQDVFLSERILSERRIS